MSENSAATASTALAARHSCLQLVATLRAGGFAPQLRGGGAAILRGAVVDSRAAAADLIFVARRGAQSDGHDFIAAAYKNGCRHFLVRSDYSPPIFIAAEATFIAVAGSTERALFAWARAYRCSLRYLYVIAISGSYGKTSTKELLGWILAQRYRCHITAGNRNTPVGCALTILGLAPETEFAVLELGIDHLGEMDLLGSLAQPNAALLTGIGSAHLGAFGTRTVLARQKARLYAHLRSFGAAAPLALLPASDGFIQLLEAEVAGGGRKIMYSAELAKQRGYGVEDHGLQGLRFTYSYQSGHTDFSCDLPLLGLHTQQIFWAAAAAAENLGLGKAAIFAGARHYRPLFGRGELRQVLLKRGTGVTLLQDCYNASPESLYALVTMLHSWGERNLLPPCVLVLADMLELGAASAHYHRQVAKLLYHFWGSAAPARLTVLLYGPQMKQAWNSLVPSSLCCNYLNDEAELARAMAAALMLFSGERPPLLVLKGARGLYLEKIVQKILL